MVAIKRPTSHKGRKFLANRDPKVIENKKQLIFVNGRKGSVVLHECLKDLYMLKMPDAIKLGQKNSFVPFDSSSELEILAKKYDSSLIFFGSHTKKRPNNVILCRTFDHNILDMLELGIVSYKGISEFSCEKITMGLKPCLIFSGPLFEHDNNFKRIQNIFVDFFQRESANNIRLQGLEHVIMFTAVENLIFMRSYRVLLKKSGCRTPKIYLEELGPSIDFEIRRKTLASDDFFKEVCRQPSELKEKITRNIRKDTFGSKLGRVHLNSQKMSRLQTRKMKGLRKSVGEKRSRQRKAK